MLSKLLYIVSVIIININILEVIGHGYLADPPSRSSAWRFGFKTVPNYNDNQLFCGGFYNQWYKNNGKCGICGDPYQGPLSNELPNGRWAKSLVITRNYTSGQQIGAKVILTANHIGYFQFKLCPAKSMAKEVTQQCLDNNILPVLNSTDKLKFLVPNERPKRYVVPIQLPANVTCDRCVIQWTYTAGNNWGDCGNGTSGRGCGPQETFRGCADVKIV